MIDKKTGEKKTIVKIRGITIDSETAKAINFERLQEMVDNYINNLLPLKEEKPPKIPKFEIITTKRLQIKADKFSEIVTKQQEKNYQIVNTKGLINPKNYKVLPFGYFE